jgi:hypothetical protein
MLAIRHWLSLRDKRGAAAWVTLEAPLIQLGTIALPYAPFPLTLRAEQIRRSTVYSWALNNIWDTNFPVVQGGEMTFTYTVSSSNNPAAARELGIRTGAALTAPFVGICLRERFSGESSMPAIGSFVTVSNALVEVVALTPTRRGDDVVALLQSLAPESVTTRIACPTLPIGRISAGNYLQRQMRELPTVDGEAELTLAPGAYIAVAFGGRE